MKKHFFRVLMLAMLVLFPYQNVLATDYCTYEGNSTDSQDSNTRYLSSFTLTDGTTTATATDIQQAALDVVYANKTSVVLETTPGATITPTATWGWNGNWQGHYVYIDYDNNKEFDQVLNSDGTTGGELVVSSGTDSHWASDLVAFTLPSDLAPGDYRLRYKIDWASTDPCGTSGIVAMVDMTIRIPGEARTITVLSNSSEAGTVSGGGTISGGTVITATANSGYDFVNWTDENGNEVSTSATFDDFSAGDKTYVANFSKTLDRSGWEITVDGEGYDSTNSSSSVEGPKTNMIDGLTTTFWHSYYSGRSSSWGDENLPHYMQFNLGSVQSFDAFNYVSRDGSTSQNGNIVAYKLYISNSDMTSSLGSDKVPTNGTLISSGEFTYDGSSAEHKVELGETYSGQYVFLLATSENGSQNKFANCAEFYLYQTNFDVTVSAVAGEGGTVAVIGGTDGSITVNKGTEVTLTATPAENYAFVSWTNSAGDVVSDDATYTFNATTTDTYTANFAQKLSVSIASNDTNMGTVAFEDGTTATKYVGANGTVTVVATPASNVYKFVSWSNGSTDATQTVTITENTTLTATFAAKATPTVSITSENGTLALTVNGEPAEIGATTLYEGDEIALTATPATGYKFVKWRVNGADAGTDATYTTTIATTDLTITPVFEALKQFTINIEQPTGGTITVVDAEGNNITSAYEGESITIAISVESAYGLEGLYINNSIQGLDANNSISVTLTEAINSEINITAVLKRLTAEELYSALTAPTFGKAGNMLSATGATVLDGAEGAIVGTVTNSTIASPQPMYISTGAQFDLQVSVETEGWYGMHFHLMHNAVDNIIASYGYFGSTTSASVSTFWEGVLADTRLTANSTDNTITFPISLSEEVKVGDIIVLRALGSSPVDQISPVGSYSEGSYVDFLFHVVEAEVTVSANPTEGGTVTMSPTEENIKIGTSVTLTATPDEGYAFANWTDANGTVVSSEPIYTFSATKENTYTANFSQAFTVSIASNDNAMGTVAFSGEEASVTTKEVVSGTQVTVTATPASNAYKFVSWSNGSTDATQTVTITENTTLTATFAAKTEYTVTVTSVEGGSVTYTVGGEEVDKIYEGDEVTFTATPTADTDYIFVKWVDGEGNPLSTANPYTVIVSSAITIAPVYVLSAQYTHDLFNTSNGSLSIPTYRIPAIAKTSTGRLIAVASYQVCGTDPGYGEVDLACRMSDNNGKTWTDEKIIADGNGEVSTTENYFETAFGDAAIVADREKEEVIIVVVAGCTVYNNSATTRKNPNMVGIMRSTDNGDTWTEPEDITEAIYGLFDDGYPLASAFVASGKIFQSRVVKVGDYYRIYAAMCARPNGNRVIYSDDFGRTWKPLGGEFALPVPSGDEPKCEEMPDGRVIISSRTTGGRYYNIYTYTNTATAAGSWGTVSNMTFASESQATNGEILILPVTRKSDNTDMYLALQSLPVGTSTREDVTIFYKELTAFEDYNTVANFASSWDGSYKVTDNTSAYSTMVLQDNGRVAFFYEDTYTKFGTQANPNSTCLTSSSTHNYDGYNNIYTSYEIEDITNDAYTLNLDVNRGTIVKDYLTTLVSQSSVEDEVKSELKTEISGFGDDPTPAQVDAIYSVLYADPFDGQVVTFTNMQYSGNTHVMYVSGDSLLLSANGVTAASLGTSAQFLCTKMSNGKYTFKNLASDNYMIYRNTWNANENAIGTNENNGILSTYDATYCDWTLGDGSGTVEGTYYMYAGRPRGDQSYQIVLSSGVFDGWSVATPGAQYAEGYSNLFKIEVVEFEGIEELIATGQEILLETGVGYPSGEATVRNNLNTAIANASNYPSAVTGVALQNAIDAYYASTDVVLPTAGTVYSFIVGHAEKAYIYNNNGTLAVATYTDGMELPETAKFTCEVSDSKFLFKNGTVYMAYPTQGTGVSETNNQYTQFSVTKLLPQTNVELTNEELFGKVYLEGTRSVSAGDQAASIVVKFKNNGTLLETPTFDPSSTPYGNDNYSSAISIVEVNDVPERTITVKVNPANAATITINGATATEVTAEGAITLVATPKEGYGFKNWTDESGAVVSTDATLVDNTEGNKTYTANLVVGYSVTASVKEGQESFGTVEVKGGSDGVFGEGSEATLVAKPASGYVFKQWTLDGYTISTKSTYTTVIMKNENYVAEFEKGYIEMTLHYILSSGATSEARSNRYLASVTAVADKGGENELTTVVFEATNEAGLPRVDAEATAFAANSDDGYTTVPTTSGALIDKTGNTIKVLKGTTTLDLTFKAWSESMVVRGYTAAPELNQTQQAIYVDWNNDQDFEGDEIYGVVADTYPNDAYTSTDGYTRQITIPTGTEAGSYRMRVIYFDPVSTGLTDWVTAIVDETIGEDDELSIYRDINQGRAYDFTIQVVEDENYITFDAPGDTYYTVGEKAEVTLTYPVEGAKIYYTVDGTDPNIYDAEIVSGGKVALNTYQDGEVVVKAIAVVEGVESETYSATYHIAVKELTSTTVETSTVATTITAAEISDGTGVTNGVIDHAFYQGQQEAIEPVMVTSTASFNLDLTIDLNQYGITIYKGEILTSSSNWGLAYDYIGSTNASVEKDKFVADLTTKGLSYSVVDEENAIYKVSIPVNMATDMITAESFKQSESLVYRVIVSSVSGNVSATTQDFGTGEYVDFVFTVEPQTQEVKFYGTAGSSVAVSVTTTDGCYVSLAGVTANLTANETIKVETPLNAAGEFAIQSVGGNLSSIDIEALDCETEIMVTQSDVINSITLKSDADNNAATVSPSSDLNQGVQVVVEKEIYTPKTLADGTTPTIFNFLSMPFAFNTADIKYWDGDSWETAEPENHVRILTYNCATRANGDYNNTWEKVAEGGSIDIAANQGFVIVGNNDLGETVKLQFTSAANAYTQDGTTKTVATVANGDENSHELDKNWNIVGAPYLASVANPAKTIYTNNGYQYGYTVPAEDYEIKPYQAFMLQTTETLEFAPVSSVAALSITKASEGVYAKAYISVDESTPAKIILSDESSENFVVNEDAWYMAPTSSSAATNYFIVDGCQAGATVQPEATELPMTVYTGSGTTHTISLTRLEGENNIFLKDAATDEVVCLNDEDYTFTATAKTTISDRFTVSMVEPTGITESVATESKIKAVATAEGIKLFGTEQDQEVALYTANGMLITNQVAEDSVTTIETSATGVIIIKVADETVKVVK